ncbi:ser/Thr protein phosphatase family protein [Teratosphaeria destructans]|uniref:Ser/Thr protein phosphatase family protein n=1 Tax=Teratosphaeria destructans TaxID=418781 RepID=A0A9W7SWY9_9PEZI|nr:ser/Thr protein phosphatase family protein [Teratosphaeria destructans]
MEETVATRFLVLSDTHGDDFHLPSGQTYDVAIHCGDLTEESKLAEFEACLKLLCTIDAPLKLVIGGNHDFTLDTPMFKRKLDEHSPPLEVELVRREYGDFGHARALFDAEDARENGIVFLDEGTHQFELQHGARLTLYASPFTPSKSDWAFQYRPAEGHTFDMPEDVDVVVTHGPPKGIMDYTDARYRAGCADLFSAIYRSRPQMHCFGHIHEGWGAKKVHWRLGIPEDDQTHFTAIDNDKSVVLENLAGLQSRKFDTPERKVQKATKAKEYTDRGYCLAAETIEPGEETLCVNAALQGTDDHQMQLPWIVKLHLPRSRSSMPTHSSSATMKRKLSVGKEGASKKIKGEQLTPE